MSAHSNIAFFIPHMGCGNLCSFCNQNVISGKALAPTFEEVRKVCDAQYKRMSPNQRKNTQIAFFGGSFTAIDRKLMVGYLDCVSEYVGNGGFSGVRVSTRPDCIDDEILDILQSRFVNSIELGAQSMDDCVLKKNLRGHTSFDTECACNKILDRGIELGLQIMVGLPGQSAWSVFETANKIVRIFPRTIRIYPTVVFRGTLLEKWYHSGQYRPLGLDEGVDLCSKLLELFNKNNIKVIRLGLHSQKDIEREMVAGIYHPSFRELCESRIYLKKLKNILKNCKSGSYKILANGSEISKVVGHKRSNVLKLRDSGYLLKVVGDDSVAVGDLMLL